MTTCRWLAAQGSDTACPAPEGLRIALGTADGQGIHRAHIPSSAGDWGGGTKGTVAALSPPGAAVVPAISPAGGTRVGQPLDSTRAGLTVPLPGVNEWPDGTACPCITQASFEKAFCLDRMACIALGCKRADCR